MATTTLSDLESIGNALKVVSGLSAKVFEAAAKGMLETMHHQNECCCPPCDECPPYCLLTLKRHAYPGEVIIVPFKVRNACGVPKQYRFGVRPLLNQHGQPAPSQPTLDKTFCELQPGQSICIELRLDLTQGYRAGQEYETVIVVRQKEHNQNICFTLCIDSCKDAPVAEPIDEKKLNTHFVSWKHHYYCEPKPRPRPPQTDPTVDPVP